ncbi:MAG: Glycine cleavage system H protein (lipoate-binding) [Candidatus Methanomarinus sp.]|nr:MAG: Glycine cleavage system H protein (lipoate-binding) [ANME-2 cluster archaeon]
MPYEQNIMWQFIDGRGQYIVSQISLPFDCVVEEVNAMLWDDPNLINDDPYEIWMVKVKGDMDRGDLMDVGAAGKYYSELIKKEKERYAGY